MTERGIKDSAVLSTTTVEHHTVVDDPSRLIETVSAPSVEGSVDGHVAERGIKDNTEQHATNVEHHKFMDDL